MKKLFLLSSTIILLISCSVTKENRSYQKAINGRWVVDEVTYEGPNGKYNIENALGEGKPECFIGSIWNLIQNNSSGNYTLPGGAECNSGTKMINWSVYQPANGLSYFQFKVIHYGNKAKDILSGYRLGIDRVSQDEMELRSSNKIEGENQTYDIIYHFKRDNQ